MKIKNDNTHAHAFLVYTGRQQHFIFYFQAENAADLK